MAERAAVSARETTETKVRVAVDLDGGDVRVATGEPFFDHMLDQLGRHGRIGLVIDARGDLEIDAHHTVEDVGITLGQALADALGDKRGINRYGDALVPMEEALAQVALDISGRPHLSYEADIAPLSSGRFDVRLTREFLNALCRSASLTMHVRLLESGDPHHATEAIFKSVARALAQAVAVDPRNRDAIPSTKGVI